MPSPIGHALGGLIVALALAPHEGHEDHDGHEGNKESKLRVLRGLGVWAAAAACLPDIDFLWGRHNMETHSIGFAVLVGLAMFAWRRDMLLSIVCALAVSTHVLFDWLGSDDAAPIGVMALWPLTTQFFFADAWLFDAISRRYWRDDFVSQNVIAIAKELLLLGTPALALLWWRRR